VGWPIDRSSFVIKKNSPKTYGSHCVHKSGIRNHALHVLTFIIDCRKFCDYRGFLIRYSNSDTK
jgi:hypothetical protein